MGDHVSRITRFPRNPVNQRPGLRWGPSCRTVKLVLQQAHDDPVQFMIRPTQLVFICPPRGHVQPIGGHCLQGRWGHAQRLSNGILLQTFPHAR